MPKQAMRVLREQTRRFIAENPADISFTRHTKVPDGAGGSTSTAVPLTAQRVRAVDVQRMVAVQRRTIGGVMVTPDLNVVAQYDADVQRGDTFVWNGINMEVVWVNDPGYEKVAEAVAR